MKQALQAEIKKFFKQSSFHASLLAFLILFIAHIIENIQFYIINKKEIAYAVANNPAGMGTPYPRVLIRGWIGCELSGVVPEVYYYILPLLAVIPFAVTYYSEHKSGYIKNVAVHIKRKHYIAAKAIVAGISGGIFATLPQLASWWFCALHLPDLPMNPMGMETVIDKTYFLGKLFYSAPTGYIFAFIGIAFVYGALFALLAMVVAHVAQNIFIVYVFPVFYYIFTDYFLQATDFRAYAPRVMLSPDQTRGSFQFIHLFAAWAFLLVGALAVLSYHKKKDVLC